MPSRNTRPRAHVDGLLPIPISNNSESELSTASDNGSESEEQEQATEEAVLLSRKEKRRLRRHRNQHNSTEPLVGGKSQSATPSNTETKKRKSQSLTTASVPRLPRDPMPPMKYYPLLVCSIGNPGTQYAKTLHSAGHSVIKEIHARGLYQPFTKGLSGLVARPSTTNRVYGVFSGYTKVEEAEVRPGAQDDFTLWQSTHLMNISGGSVKKAWTAFSAEQSQRGLEPRLVVVHDELESDLGKVTVKDGASSARGHNGLKSIQAALTGKLKWWRVGVGIGRPQSREADVVSQYVLRKMTPREEAAIDKAAASVLRAVQDIADGTR